VKQKRAAVHIATCGGGEVVREGDKGLLGRRWRWMGSRSDFQNTHQKERERERIERGKEKESKEQGWRLWGGGMKAKGDTH
jgi:hypothetical protein